MGKFLGVGSNPWPGKFLLVWIIRLPLHVSKGNTGGGSSDAGKESFASLEFFAVISIFSSNEVSSCCGSRNFGSFGSGSSDNLEASDCLDEERDSKPDVLVKVRLFSDVVINSRKLALSLAETSERSEDVKLSPQLSMFRFGLLSDSLVIGLSGGAGQLCFSVDMESNADMEVGDDPLVLDGAGVKGLELGSSVDWRMPTGSFAVNAEMTEGFCSAISCTLL